MKITVDISDPLLAQTKRCAASHGTTTKALIEQGLRLVLADKARAASFDHLPVTDGLPHAKTGYDSLSWEQVRDLIYEGRGARCG
jgi:hypothetical protein